MPTARQKPTNPVPMPSDTPTTKANVLAQVVEGLHEMHQTLGAWFRFGAEVTGYLNSKGLADDFEAWRAKQKKIAKRAARR